MSPVSVKPFLDKAPSWEDAVPDGLAPVLFPDDTLTTYALIDAARATNLPERLETSGLPYACLFQGAAERDMGEVAPWLVALQPQHSFTFSLFADTGAPWDLWPKQAGIFVRSHLGLQALRSHLRRFVYAKDAKGKGMYIRFWEPKWTLPIVSGMNERDASSFLSGISLIAMPFAAGRIERILVDASIADIGKDGVSNANHGERIS